MQHQSALSANPRTALMVNNLQRFDGAARRSMQREAQRMVESLDLL